MYRNEERVVVDKYLTGGEWKKFCKKPEYKADPLLKAMAALEKAEKQGPDEQLKALDELDKQAEVLLKAHKADKILTNYLGEVAKASKKLRTDTSAAQAAAERASKDEDDEPPSALLDPKKLLSQLNQCKRDPDRTVHFAFVDAKDKQPACLAMSPKMGSKMLFAKLQQASGVKTGAYGSAWVDGTQLMLQLDKPMGGLVKKIRGPVKECGFRITKAVLWNEDGTVFEQDEQADDDAAAPGAPAP
jgi:hypothetical protein